MTTGNSEGVTKYRLEFTASAPPDPKRILELNAWRSIIRMLGLNGLDPKRYGGVAYGNVSIRLPGNGTDGIRFLISGTQTGGLDRLTHRDYCEVDGFDLSVNRITAHGLIAPSSEALTHAAVYQADPAWTCVMHAHAPEIWCRADQLGLPSTLDEIEYGTPEMAAAVQALATEPGIRLIAMRGHPDGIIAYGQTVEATARILIGYLAASLQLENG